MMTHVQEEVSNAQCTKLVGKNSPVWCSAQRISSPVLVHSCICITIIVPVHVNHVRILFMCECTQHFSNRSVTRHSQFNPSTTVHLTQLLLYPAALLLSACSQANIQPTFPLFPKCLDTETGISVAGWASQLAKVMLATQPPAGSLSAVHMRTCTGIKKMPITP